MDKAELRRLYEKYIDTVYRVCYTYLRSPADSEDAAQEVFLKLMSSQPVFSCESDERGWLIVTACNHCKSVLRWKKRHPVADGSDLTEQSVTDESDAEVLDLLSALPHDCRQVVYMHCCEGYSLADIARLSGAKASTVRSRWFYARKKLNKILGGMDDE